MCLERTVGCTTLAIKHAIEYYFKFDSIANFASPSTLCNSMYIEVLIRRSIKSHQQLALGIARNTILSRKDEIKETFGVCDLRLLIQYVYCCTSLSIFLILTRL